MHSSVSSDKHILLCSANPSYNTEHQHHHHPRKFLLPLPSQFLPLKATAILIFLPPFLFCSRISYTWNHTVCSFEWRLLSPSIIFLESTHVVSCVRPEFVPFYSWVVFHWKKILRLVQPVFFLFIDTWTVSRLALQRIPLLRTVLYTGFF